MRAEPNARVPSLPATGVFADLVAGVLGGRDPRPVRRPGRDAAVLLPIVDRGGAPHIVLTKRANDLSHHPGQVSFPGGRPERSDGGAAATALRETYEELAIPPEAITLLGELDQMHTVATDFVISPFVGLVHPATRIEPNAAEVAGVLVAPVSELLRADAALPPRPGRLEVRYPLDGEDVWGATAHILRGFAAIIRAALDATDASSA